MLGQAAARSGDSGGGGPTDHRPSGQPSVLRTAGDVLHKSSFSVHQCAGVAVEKGSVRAMIQRIRILRTLSLFVALHLLLQPLTSTAWCAVVTVAVGHCCCVGELDQPDEAVAGCCSPEAPSGDSEDGDNHGTPCDCSVSPGQAPAISLDSAEAAARASALEAYARGLILPAGPWERIAPALRVRAPGAGPPVRLLTQVFRL